MPTTSIKDIREKYPQYSDLSDEDLAKGLHRKYYSDMEYDQFAERIGLRGEGAPEPEPREPRQQEDEPSGLKAFERQPGPPPQAGAQHMRDRREAAPDVSGQGDPGPEALLGEEGQTAGLTPFGHATGDAYQDVQQHIKDSTEWERMSTPERVGASLTRGAKNLGVAGDAISVMRQFDRGREGEKIVEQAKADLEAVQNNPDLSAEERQHLQSMAENRLAGAQKNVEQAKERLTQAVTEIHQGRSEAAEIPSNPTAQRAIEAESFGEFWDHFSEDPLGVIGQIGTESLPLMAPGMALGVAGGATAGPAGFAAGMGTGSGSVEFALSLVEGLERNGADLSDPESVRRTLEEHGDEIRNTAFKRGAAVGLFDAATGAVATTRLVPRAPAGGSTASRVARDTAEAGAQLTTQAAGGMAGETTAQALEGEGFRPGEIAAEGAGEFITGPVDPVVAAASGARARGTEQQPSTPHGEPIVDDDMVGRLGEQLRRAQRNREGVSLTGPDETLRADPEGNVGTERQFEEAQRQQQETGATEDVRRAAEQHPGRARPAEAPAQDLSGQRVSVDGLQGEWEVVEPVNPSGTVWRVRNRAGETRDAGTDLMTPLGEQPRALPAPDDRLYGTPEGQVGREQDIRRQQTERGEMGMTPDVERAAQRHPGRAQPRDLDLQEGDVPRRDGQPFRGRGDAQASAKQRGLRGHKPVQVGENAWVLRPKTLDDAANEAATSPANDLPEPTEGQKGAGNYQLGSFRLQGLDVAIENPRGSVRRGTDQGGQQWEQELTHHYGYIRRTEGKDGDHVDVFLGPQAEADSPQVFVVDQVDPRSGKFDEHKVMFGFPDEAAARQGYLSNYEDGWQGLGGIRSMPLDEFKQWVREGDTKRPVTDMPEAEGVASRTSLQQQISDVERDLSNASTATAREALRSELDRLRKLQEQERPKLSQQERMREIRRVDPGADDLATAIRKLGGIDTDLENDWSGRLQGIGGRKPGLPALERPGKGRSLDDLAETLNEMGYLQTRDARELAEKLEQVETGTPVYSIARETAAMEQQMEDAERAREAVVEPDDGGMDIDEIMSVWQEIEAEGVPGELYTDAGYQQDADELHQALTDVLRAARSVQPDMAERIMEDSAREGVSDAEVIRRLLPLIRGDQDGAQTQAEGVDQPRTTDADAGDGATRAGGGAQAATQGDQGEQGLTLTPQQAPSQQPRPRTEQQQDAFGRDEAAQARQDAEEARRRREREAPPAESEEGLFSGGERQTDVEDVSEQGETVTLTEPMRVYHGTQAGVSFDRFDRSQANTGVGANAFDQGNQFYATTSERAARWFAGRSEENRQLKQGAMPEDDAQGEVLDFELPAGSRILRVSDMPRMSRAEDMIRKAREQGYDAIQFPDRGFETVEGSREVFDIINEEGLPETLIILNDEVVSRADTDARQAQPEPEPQEAQSAPQAEPRQRSRQESSRIEDFGEELAGARKHYAQSYNDRLSDVPDSDVENEPLSKSWPEPDYQKLLDDGVDPRAVAFVRAARDEIPTKPKRPHRRRLWAEQVRELRSFSQRLLAGQTQVEGLDNRLGFARINVNELTRRLDNATSRAIQEVAGRMELYEAVGHEKSLKGIRLQKGEYSMYAGERFDPPKVIWTVEQSSRSRSGGFSNMPRVIAKGDTKEAAIKGFKEKYDALKRGGDSRQTKFEIYRRHGMPEYIIGKKVGRDHLDLKTFDDLSQARKYLVDNHDDLVKALEKAKEVPPARRETNAPRVGVDHRNGQDVTPDMFTDAFGFRGVQFGNYVEGGRRQVDLNDAYDALMDLAGILGVPSRALSLNGELGLAFGARGKGGKNAAAAHFERDTVVINLTKKGGAGSLAHEWWHALDNHFSRRRGRTGGYITEKPRVQKVTDANNRVVDDTSVRPEVVDAFRGVVDAIQRSGLPQRSRQLDQRRSKDYWSTIIEMSARSFETYVVDRLHDQSQSNDYLANIVSEQAYGEPQSYPYPSADEMPTIRAAFDRFFDTLETREEGENVAMFSRRPGPRTNWGDFPDAVILNDSKSVQQHADYRAAKAGDPESAYRLVEDTVDADDLKAIRDAVGDRSPIVVGVHAEERVGRNKIPSAFSAYVADALGYVADESIVQAEKVSRGGSDGFHRLANPPSFKGDVESGRDYVILDDTLAQGGTFAALKGYIENNGGNVILASALMGKQYSAKLSPSADTLTQVRERYGQDFEQWFQQEFGYGLDQLTQSEARYLATVRGQDAQSVRDRILAARQAGRDESVSPDGGGTAQSRRRVTDDQGLPRADVQAAVDGLMDDWANAPDVNVVQSESDLPQGIQGEIRAAGATGTVRGVFKDGQVHLVADNIHSQAEAEETVLHEVVGHHGLRELLGKDFTKLLDDIYLKVGRSGLQGIADQYGFDLNTQTGRRQAAEEKLAHLAQENPKSSIWDRFVKMFAEWMRKMGFRVRLTGAEIRDLIARARHFVEMGEQVTGSSVVAEHSLYRGTQHDDTAQFSRRDDDPLGEAMRRAGLNPRKGGLRQFGERLQQLTWGRMQALSRELGDAARQGSVDRFYGILRAETRHVGNLPAEQSGYVAARLTTSMASVMRSLLHHGAPQWRDGIVSKVEGSKGLLDVLEPVRGDLDTFLGWMVARRAQRLMEEGREHNLREQDIDALMEAGKASPHFKQFEKVAKDLDAFKKRVLDVAEEAGLINPETRPMWDQADYIPFYRVSEEAQRAEGPRSRGGLSGQTSGIRTLQGGEQVLNDPLENLIMNFTHLMDAAMKNHAIRQVRDNLDSAAVFEDATPEFKAELIPLSQVKSLLRERGVDVDLIPPEALRGVQKMWAMKAPSDPDVVRIMDEGKTKYYRVTDPLLLRALTAVRDPGLSHPIIKAMRGFKRIFTRGITADPSFMARNFLRDALHAWTINEDGFKLGSDSLRGVAKALKEKGGMVDMMFAGGSFQGGYVNANDPGETARAIRGALRAKGYSAAARENFLGTIIDTPAKWWEAYTHVGDAIENASREAVYEAAAKAGKSRAQRVFEAKDLMDYSMRGDWAIMQFFADTLPFFNARLQGLYKLGRAGTHHPGRVMARGSLIALASLGLLARNWNDERYEELPDWDKDTYWHIFFPDWMPEWLQHLRIPKPFEIGVLFGTLPERWARNMLERDTNEQTFERFLWSTRETFAFDPLGNPVAKVPIELWANRDAFRDAPIEGLSDQGKLPQARYSEYTSATARAIGEVTGPSALELSPKQLEHAWRGFTGQMGMYMLDLADIASRSMQDLPPRPTPRIDDYPVVKSFLRAEPARNTKYLTRLYDLHREASQIYRSMRDYRKSGEKDKARKLLTEERPMLKARSTLNRGSEALSDIRNQMEKVYQSRTMSPEQKRERIDRLLEKRNRIAKRTVERADEIIE